MGKTGMCVEQNAFGALPIQRVSLKEATYILQKALDGGMNFFDTARGYTDSEEKLGVAFEGKRDKYFLATKTPSQNAEGFWKDLETSLRLLKTDYIDVYQLHNPTFCPKPGDESGLYDAMLQAKKEGKIRFIGITNHRLNVAMEAIESDLYSTLQFPFSYLSTDKDIALVDACKKHDMPFIAMKALSGGLLTNSAAACAWMSQFDNVVPIWGIQRESELDEFLSYIPTPPALDAAMQATIDADLKELQGNFCRGCGYCLPCPKEINIPMCARASLLLKRAPSVALRGEEGQAMMKKIDDCIECGQCAKKCPYGLNPPELLKRDYAKYKAILAAES